MFLSCSLHRTSSLIITSSLFICIVNMDSIIVRFPCVSKNPIFPRLFSVHLSICPYHMLFSSFILSMCFFTIYFPSVCYFGFVFSHCTVGWVDFYIFFCFKRNSGREVLYPLDKFRKLHQRRPFCLDFHLRWDQIITLNKSAIFLVNDWRSQNNLHYQLLRPYSQ
jgi:hypothetical protein